MYMLSCIGGPVQVNRKHGALLAYGLWVNYQSKYLEYLDTAFMIVRKKFDQVRVCASVRGWVLHGVGVLTSAAIDCP